MWLLVNGVIVSSRVYQSQHNRQSYGHIVIHFKLKHTFKSNGIPSLQFLYPWHWSLSDAIHNGWIDSVELCIHIDYPRINKNSDLSWQTFSYRFNSDYKTFSQEKTQQSMVHDLTESSLLATFPSRLPVEKELHLLLWNQRPGASLCSLLILARSLALKSRLDAPTILDSKFASEKHLIHEARISYKK